MPPEREGSDLWFSAPEAADVLGVSRQAVYAAMSSGQLRAEDKPQGKRVHVQNLLAYGIQNGKNPKDLVSRIEQHNGTDQQDLLLWVLGGLGLLFLIKTLLGKK